MQQQSSTWPAAIVLIAATVLYCLPLFGNPGHWGRQDWDQFSFRYETARVALLRDRVLPSWNPYANGGTVLLAHPDSPVLSPWFAIVLGLGTPIGLRVQVAAFMAIGAIGMAVLLGRMGASRTAGLAGGVVFMMSAHYALHITEGHIEWTVLGLMPWLALLIARLHEGIRVIVGAALLAASALMFGAVYIPAIYLPFFSVWIALEACRTRRWQTLAGWFGVVAIAALLSAPKLLPMLAFTSAHVREIDPYQATAVRTVVAGLLDPRQAVLYQTQRDIALADDDVLRTVSGHSARTLEGYLDLVGVGYFGFHEYGAYISAAGLVLAATGAAASWKTLWPLYVSGALSLVVILGSRSPIDLWAALQRLPLYGQLHVPSRFLAALVFVLAVAAAMGLDAIAGRFADRTKRLVVGALLLAAIFLELAVMGRALLGDVFVVPPVPIAAQPSFTHQRTGFPNERYRAYMTSAMFPSLVANIGVLEAYENLAVAQGSVDLPDASGYRGELYLNNGHGSLSLIRWTMSRVETAVVATQPDTVILNQNFDAGWLARRTSRDGRTDIVRAQSSDKGLIAVPVTPEHQQLLLYYRPPGLVAGAWISGMALSLCLAVMLWR